MERKFNFSTDEYYHIYNRGTDKRIVYLDERDRLRFLVLLYITNSNKAIHVSDYIGKQYPDFFNVERGNTLVDIGAYCLMPNHFHILVRAKDDRGISTFMLKLLTAYTMYFNKKHQRTGSLFEGTFRAKHVDDDTYLRYLFAYIHLNPIKIVDTHGWEKKNLSNEKKAKEFLDSYNFSSYKNYADKTKQGPENVILNMPAFPSYFENQNDFTEYLDTWLNYS